MRGHILPTPSRLLHGGLSAWCCSSIIHYTKIYGVHFILRDSGNTERLLPAAPVSFSTETREASSQLGRKRQSESARHMCPRMYHVKRCECAVWKRKSSNKRVGRTHSVAMCPPAARTATWNHQCRGSRGRWTKEEHEAFLRGIELYGRDWESIATIVTTRTVLQIRTHAQKYVSKMARGVAFPEKVRSLSSHRILKTLGNE